MRFEQVFGEAAWVRRLAQRLAGDPDDVEQDTWIAAWRSPPAQRESVRGWLTRVLQNAARKQARGRARRGVREVASAELASVLPVPTPEDLLTMERCRAELVRRVNELPASLRDPLLLRYFHDLTSSEIARALGVPAGTVRRRLKEAIDRLRGELDETYGERSAWMALVVPGGARKALRSSAFAAARTSVGAKGGALALVIVTLLMVFVVRRRGTPPPGAEGPDAVPSGDRDDRVRSRVVMAPGPWPNLAACRTSLAVVEGKLRDAAEKRLELLNGAELYAEGGPNGRAEAVFRPALERALSSGDSPVATSFECRTYACRLSAIEPKRRDEGSFMALMMRRKASAAPDWLERFLGQLGDIHVNPAMALGPAAPTRDVLSGASGHEFVVYFDLGDTWTDNKDLHLVGEAPVESELPPATVEACSSRHLVVEARLAATETEIRQRTRKRVDWLAELKRLESGNGRPADAVTRSGVLSLVGPAATHGDRWSVTCDADFCFAKTEEGDRRAMANGLLAGGTEWTRTHVSNAFVHADGRVVLKLDREGHADGQALLEDVLAQLERDARLPSCRVDQPGSLEVKLDVAARLEPDDPPAAIASRFGGALAASPAKACVEQLLAEVIRRRSLPDRVGGASATRSWSLGR